MLVTAINKIDRRVIHNAAAHKLSSDWIINPPVDILNTDPSLWVFEENTVRLATVEEQDVIHFPLLKVAKLQALDDWWRQREVEGIRIVHNSTDITLGITPDDIALINGLYTSAKDSVSLGYASSNTDFQLHDIDGNMHLFKLAELTTVLLLYSQARAQLHATRNAKKKAIQLAANKSELDLVEIPNG